MGPFGLQNLKEGVRGCHLIAYVKEKYRLIFTIFDKNGTLSADCFIWSISTSDPVNRTLTGISSRSVPGLMILNCNWSASPDLFLSGYFDVRILYPVTTISAFRMSLIVNLPPPRPGGVVANSEYLFSSNVRAKP